MPSLIAALQDASINSPMNVPMNAPVMAFFAPQAQPDYPTPHEAALAWGLIAAILGIYLTILSFMIVANYVIYGVALSMFFRKVGVEPWIGWIPFYNRWKWLEVGGQRGFWSLFVFVPGAALVAAIFLYIGMWRSNIAFRQSTGIFVLGIFFPFVWLFIMASRAVPYEPDLIRQAGYGPPLAGYAANSWSAPTTGPTGTAPPPPPPPASPMP